jgi:hypothetical protein
MQPVLWHCLPQTGWKHELNQGKTQQSLYCFVAAERWGAGFLTGDRISGGRALALAFLVTGEGPHSWGHS